MSQQGNAPKAPIEALTPQPQAPETKPANPLEQDPQTREKFLALARRERSIRAEQRKFEEQKKSWESEKQKLRSPEDWRNQLLKDPTSVGLSYDELAQVALHNPKESFETSQLRQELAALREANDALKQQFEGSQKSSYDQAVKQLSREVTRMVDGTDTYPMIKDQAASDAVVELVERIYKEEGTLLSKEEAAQQIEDHLQGLALKFANHPVIKAKLSPPVIEAEQPLNQQQPKASPSPTLTNSLSSSSTRPLTAKERRERAIQAAMGQLKG